MTPGSEVNTLRNNKTMSRTAVFLGRFPVFFALFPLFVLSCLSFLFVFVHILVWHYTFLSEHSVSSVVVSILCHIWLLTLIIASCVLWTSLSPCVNFLYSALSICLQLFLPFTLKAPSILVFRFGTLIIFIHYLSASYMNKLINASLHLQLHHMYHFPLLIHQEFWVYILLIYI